jgi:hypothetical protein
LVKSQDIRGPLVLIKNNVPFDVAFSLDPEEVLAWSIIFGEMEGGVWNWAKMGWEERK